MIIQLNCIYIHGQDNTFRRLSFFQARSTGLLLFADAAVPVFLFSAPFVLEYPLRVFRSSIESVGVFFSSKLITVVPSLDKGRQHYSCCAPGDAAHGLKYMNIRTAAANAASDAHKRRL